MHTRRPTSPRHDPLLLLLVLALAATACAVATVAAVPLPTLRVGSRARLHAQLQRTRAEAARLETARRDVVANIWNELRTPLASIKLLVE